VIAVISCLWPKSTPDTRYAGMKQHPHLASP
jgi:hypothetical protein